MKNVLKLLAVVSAVLLFSSCANGNTDALIKEARELIVADQAKCVLINNDAIVAKYVGGGVSPLLEVYKKNSEAMKGGVIVDKVIGRAAAFVVIKGGATRTYALLISESAKKLLEEHSVEVEYDKIVPEILNRKRDGLCPLEASVLGETDPSVALVKLEKQIKILMNSAKNNSH